MKRILISLALLVTTTMGAWAQGAGLSQGQPYVAPPPTPKKTQKTCSECGITMYNITYPWQHRTWCSHYRARNSGSSSSSRSNGYSTYTATNAAASALGSLLSGLISNGFSRRSDRKATKTAAEIEADLKRIEEYKKENAQGKMIFEEDRESWTYGDYAVSIVDEQACIRNTKTGKWVLPPYDKKVLNRDNTKVPKNAFYIPVKNDYEFNREGRICFLNSKILGTSPEFDGYLLVRGHGTWEKRDGKKTEIKWSWVTSYDALCRIVDDSLQFIIKHDPGKSIEKRKNINVVYRGGSLNYLEPIGTSPYLLCPVRVNVHAEDKGEADIKYESKYVYDKNGNIVVREIDSLETIGETFYAKFHSGEIKLFDANFKEIQRPYTMMGKTEVEGMGTLFVVEDKGAWGVVNKDGDEIIPMAYTNSEDTWVTLNYLKTISYTIWYKQEAAKYIDKKGEFEKTEHFEARMKDAKMQEEYLRDIMADAPQRYLAEKTKGGLKLTIGQYDADNEVFPINMGIAPWNSFLLPVPIAEAEAFKTAFDDIKAEALKTAQYGIRYDAPSIEAIRFTMPNGKEYYYGDQ